MRPCWSSHDHCVSITDAFVYTSSLLPVPWLEKGAIEILDGRNENRIHIKGHDEIASLAERFNRMSEAVGVLERKNITFAIDCKMDTLPVDLT